MPGTLASMMPGGGEDEIPRKIRDLERQMRELACARSLGASTIGNGGTLTVDGAEIVNGSLTVLGTISTPGTLNSAGAVNAGTSMTAGTTITAGGNIVSTGGALSVANSINGASLSVSGAISGGGVTGSSVTSTGDVSASGQGIFAGVINSPGTRANTVTVGYQSLWADASGNFGANTSSRRYKQNITPVVTDTAGFLGLTTYKFRYIANVEDFGNAAPWDYGLIAEEVVKVAPWACFYEDDGVAVKGINYDRLVVALLNLAQSQEARIGALEAKA